MRKLGLYERTCCTCGKVFEATTEHAYKKRIKGLKKTVYRWFCSYKCFREDD